MPNTLLKRIQYCYKLKHLTDLIKMMRRMVNENINTTKKKLESWRFIIVLGEVPSYVRTLPNR